MEWWRIYFSGIWCIYILGLFAVADALLTTDVSASPWYSLLQMLFFRPMYLQGFDIHCCRCSFWNQCICNLLFFELADTFKPTCHTIASASCLFWDLKILPLQILHLHPTFSITWRCSPVKLRIRNLLFQCFADTSHQNFASSIPENPLSQIPFTQYPLRSNYFTTWANTLLTKNWYKKFERIWNGRWWHLERKLLR